VVVAREELTSIGEWAPSLDLSETKDALVVKADVPGMELKDIQVSLQEQMLTIKGEKKQEKEEKDEEFHRVERSYGAFTRALRLPVPVDTSKVAASFKNGVLTVTLPKTPAAKGTAIPVKAGSIASREARRLAPSPPGRGGTRRAVVATSAGEAPLGAIRVSRRCGHRRLCGRDRGRRSGRPLRDGGPGAGRGDGGSGHGRLDPTRPSRSATSPIVARRMVMVGLACIGVG
jgi:HSP20 family protein